jgi:uncharacterized protein YqeY
MSKIDTVRSEMFAAMKAKDKPRKDALSMLLTVLKNAQIDGGHELTEDEANTVIRKEIRQTQETIDMAPADRTDIREEAEARIRVYQEFVPAEMSEEQIRAVITEVLGELGISAPTAKDKGKIMKSLMPRVKGKADGRLVNQVLSAMMS